MSENKNKMNVVPGITDEEGYVTNQEMIDRMRVLANEIIPIIQVARLDEVACVLAMLLGQNIAQASKLSGQPLETLVDKTTCAVRSSAEQDLADVPDGDSHHQH